MPRSGAAVNDAGGSILISVKNSMLSLASEVRIVNMSRKMLELARRHKLISLALIFFIVYTLRFLIIYLVRPSDDFSGETTADLEYVLMFVGAILIGILCGLIVKKPQNPKGENQQH
jgi:hypothetical protein